MKPRHTLFFGIFFLLLYGFAELLLRLALTFYGYPFFKPSDYLFHRFYPELEAIIRADTRSDDSVKDVLILGGSAASTAWSQLDTRLDSLLRRAYPGGETFAIYNAASPGHTSLDSKIKYKLLEKQRFDLVIYYEGINENRANNVPPARFRSDYTHFKWYSDLQLLITHPEINLTVFPYLLHKIFRALNNKFTHNEYISMESVDQHYVQYGSTIKTAIPYANNIAGILEMASTRGDKVLLVGYASYFPKGVSLTGDKSDQKYFACCYFSSPVTTWGKPENVYKGIQIHNQMLRKVASQSKVPFLPMDKLMPHDSSQFRDVCHFSEAGAENFAKQMARFILEKNLLE